MAAEVLVLAASRDGARNLEVDEGGPSGLPRPAIRWTSHVIGTRQAGLEWYHEFFGFEVIIIEHAGSSMSSSISLYSTNASTGRPTAHGIWSGIECILAFSA